ncbi:class I SAM-dependent methyltransferase [bacterium]|nr:class I SAM-dependent methyltransferase [bacterium]
MKNTTEHSAVDATRQRDRDTLVGYLSGDGIELGACQSPMDLSGNPRVKRVRYVDQHPRDAILRLFPELGQEASSVVETDVLCNIGEGLTPFKDGSVDFVISCHVIEHLPDPIFFIRECWRVLKPGGHFFLGAPDKYYLPDARRPATPLEHLLDDYSRKVRYVDDSHIEEFLRTWEPPIEIPRDPAERKAFFDSQRNRSIHVHAWTTESFGEFLAYNAEHISPFLLVDAAGANLTAKCEMLFVLEKTDQAHLQPADFRRKLHQLVKSNFDSQGNRIE